MSVGRVVKPLDQRSPVVAPDLLPDQSGAQTRLRQLHPVLSTSMHLIHDMTSSAKINLKEADEWCFTTVAGHTFTFHGFPYIPEHTYQKTQFVDI